MDAKKQKLEQRAREESRTESRLQGERASREFGSVEEVLREDAAQHPPPASVAERLAESIRREPNRGRGSWWSRWFGGSDPA